MTLAHRAAILCLGMILAIGASGCGSGDDPSVAAVEPELADPAPESAPPAPASPPIDEEVAELIELLGSSSARNRVDAAADLGNRGDRAEPAVPALAAALADPERLVRGHAAITLGSLARRGVESARDALVAALETPGNLEATLAGLRSAGPVAAPAVPRLRALLKSEVDDGMSLEIVGTLGAIGGSEARDALAAALDGPAGPVRTEAAWGMAAAGPPEASQLPALRRAAEDDDPEVSVPARLAIWRAERSSPPVSGLIGLLKAETRLYAALDALGEIGHSAPAAVYVVLEFMRAPDWQLRAKAATCLGKLGVGSDEVLQALVVALENTGDGIGVPASAAIALAELGPKAAPVARDLAIHLCYPGIDVFVEQALMEMGDLALPALEEVANDEAVLGEVREKAREVIGRIRLFRRR